jgi:hypothetical protein
MVCSRVTAPEIMMDVSNAPLLGTSLARRPRSARSANRKEENDMGGAFGAAGFALGLACGMPIGRIAGQRREREKMKKTVIEVFSRKQVSVRDREGRTMSTDEFLQLMFPGK